MKLVDIDEDFFIEDLFAKSTLEVGMDELREDLEWRIEELYAKEFPNDEPVISPASLWMLKVDEVQKEIDAMSEEEYKHELVQSIFERAEKWRKIYEQRENIQKNQTNQKPN